VVFISPAPALSLRQSIDNPGNSEVDPIASARPVSASVVAILQ
jgi:hypothetical protein